MSEPAPKKPRTCTAPRKIFLGASDLEVSTVCLGTMTFGRMSTDQVAHDILDRYVALGGDFVDTAEMYPVPVAPEFAGKSEEIIGRWLTANPGLREKLVIATKVAGPRGPGNAAKAKVWVGVCFVIMFCSLGGGIWIMIQARRRPRHAMPAGAARRSGRVGGGASLALGARGVGPAHVRAHRACGGRRTRRRSAHGPGP